MYRIHIYIYIIYIIYIYNIRDYIIRRSRPCIPITTTTPLPLPPPAPPPQQSEPNTKHKECELESSAATAASNSKCAIVGLCFLDDETVLFALANVVYSWNYERHARPTALSRTRIELERIRSVRRRRLAVPSAGDGARSVR